MDLMYEKGKKVELLAPAGDLEKLKIAVDYGADAVYFSGEEFGLRAGAGNMTSDEIREGMEYAHKRGVKGYMAINIIAHNDDIDAIDRYTDELKELPVDGFIVSDPGVISLLRKKVPGAELHLSTQANTTNYMSALFWREQGIKRIIAAREMSMEELRQFREKLPEDMELETFVHGAMCISYSGRCLLSSYMTGRDGNRGLCAHPCRYKYALVEEKRPGQYFPIEEDARGTYIMNSNDLCMIEHIPELIESGISSLKIEGRMKTIAYVATVVRAYRAAIDAYYKDPKKWRFDPEWLEDLGKVSHRLFYTGFYYSKPDRNGQTYGSSTYIKDYDFLGIVKSYDEAKKEAVIEQRNKFSVGDEVEIFGPGSGYFTQVIESMTDGEGTPIESAPHPQQTVRMKTKYPVSYPYMIRRKKAVKD